MSDFFAILEEFGAIPAGLHSFDEETPALLPYVTLVDARRAVDQSQEPDPGHDLEALRGVYEWQDSPLVFLVDGDRLRDDDHLRRIRRMVALRGDAPYIGVARPGQLVIHRVGLDEDPPSRTHIQLLSSREKRATFAWLGSQRPEAATEGQRGQWISKVVLKLLGESVAALTDSGVERREDALSLTGRALFVRFLGDRHLIPKRLQPVHESFDDPERARGISAWLDETFNGDFLPLDEAIFTRLTAASFWALGNILRRAPLGQLHLGWEQKWDFLDFAHIPVGVLSQAYEQHLRKFSPEKQRKEGVFYTPPVIADWMVRGAFHALRREQIAHTARVLDPAAGAGVFLLAVFRQLVAERWSVDGVRPDTATLRHILYRQIVGFDINEAALRFAALALYLMSIELDPHPRPVRKLRFKDLRGSVLLKVSCETSDEPGSDLGSLGPAVGKDHAGRYDLVIGNPPWSSATRLPDWKEVKKIVARIAGERLSKEQPGPPLPNESLDLPFAWRAMEWARPDGQVALALGARLLFQQGDGMPEARGALFEALDVTGVINGTALRETRLWPNSRAPFCLLFAKNRRPPAGAGFRFISPQLEDDLNNAGGLRVDAHNAAVVTWQQVAQRPEILKILFRGSRIDLEIIERMTSRSPTTLRAYWGDLFGWSRGRPRQTGNGYQRLRRSSRHRKDGDGKPGVSAAYLHGLPELTTEAMNSILIDDSKLGPLFSSPRIHDPRPRTLFQAPLLIVHESPPASSGRVRTAVAEQDLLFGQSYHGYSTHGHMDGLRLVRYLALLIGSHPALWYVLMASGKFGFERDTVEKKTVDTMPVVPLENLSAPDRKKIDSLFNAIVRHDTERNWKRVDAWAASVYGLQERDLLVISETLEYNLPFARNRAAGQAPASSTQVSAFCDTLASELAPWSQATELSLDIDPLELSANWPWRVVCMRTARTRSRTSARTSAADWLDVLRIADELGSTEVLYPDPSNRCLYIARLGQARYWSQTQARLVARQIVWEHPEILSPGKLA